ncbi:MAG: dihydropteroate synthase [Gammaproteobacteria bacterium]|nr:dihydropteroate synthase [Gammaproteobacteria bacterium]MDH3578389.1 dihydropteroate synthase [Gammaproteobacteria bacterium]
MGILNVTPDSFSDGGRFDNPRIALRQAAMMANAGAAIIDIGGESTRPGAKSVSDQEELDRVVPIIESVRAVSEVPISVDTSKPQVMRAAVAAGASMINDVYALQADGALAAAVELKVPVCLMHMRGEPRTMQDNPQYDDVVAEVASFLDSRIDACVAAGLSEDLIVVDPGFGFGKTHDHNVELLANLRQLRVRDRPVLVGVSRKATLGELTERTINERMPGSIAAAVVAVMQGADIIRAHDVQETVDALKVVQAVMKMGRKL